MNTPSAPPGESVREPTGRLLRESECPRCGEPFGAYQEYCLECGLRLPVDGGVGAALAGARGGRAADWAWPVLVAFVVSLLAAATVLGVKYANDDEDRSFFVATSGEPVGPPVTETQPVVTETAPEPPPTETRPPPTTAPPPPSGRLAQWPAGVDAYTVVLASLPARGGRAAALRKARQASDAGLPRVGVLDSSKFASLHPGYYVVFSGVYDSLADASRFVNEARDAGFDTAYGRLIAS